MTASATFCPNCGQEVFGKRHRLRLEPPANPNFSDRLNLQGGNASRLLVTLLATLVGSSTLIAIFFDFDAAGMLIAGIAMAIATVLCTLRLVEFHETKRTETLLQVHEDGIRGITREQPWSPIPKLNLLDLARKQWWVLVLVVIGFGASIWLKRSEIASYYDAMFGNDFVVQESLSVETDGFASYLKVDLDFSEDDNELVLSFEKLQTYPDSTSAFDALRSTASMQEAAALSAMELGYAQLELLFEDEKFERERVSLSQWDESGKFKHFFRTSDWQGRTLKGIRLTP
ncbi:MAG: hypothetical protein O3A95_08975 [Planctomycetota bacterium]|nr:hypothetical protein [Planctomycetota bacterium]MDA1114414.1 hypothetical protein [Planctomycetota bacterium]